MSDDLNNPHDSFFRGVFALRQVSVPFFQHYLPTRVLKGLDLRTLRLSRESFIDERLREQRSDLLFSVASRSGQPTLLYLLLEHKSYQERWTAFQVLGYAMRALERHAGGSGLLPPLLAVVLYHGETPWSAPTTVEALTETREELVGSGLRFGFQLCDLSQTDLEGLEQRAALAMVLQVQKHIRNNALSERLAGIFKLSRGLRWRSGQKLAFLEMILRYLAAAAGQLDETTIRAALREALPIEVEEHLMPTIAETWEARGEARGQARGKEQQAQAILRRLLVQRFGPLSTGIIQQIENADLETLDRWLDRVLVANDLDEVFIAGD